MAEMTVERIIPFAHQLVDSSHENLWIAYDREADVLYVSLNRPDVADDADYRDDGIVVRFREGKIIGYTVPGFSLT